MTEKINVSRKFLEDFDLVTKHYRCPKSEVDWLKNEARKDYEQVKKSLEIVSENIRKGYV